MAGGVVPSQLSAPEALRLVREIARDSSKVFVVQRARKRGRERAVNRRQMESCLQLGTIVEGPYLTSAGNWRMTLFRHAAGEEVHVVAEIDWPERLIVVTAY